MSTANRLLQEANREYCIYRMRLFQAHARTLDALRYQRLQSALGRPPVIWEYIEYALRDVLMTTKSIGLAGRAWMSQTGTLCRGFICIKYCTDAGQQSPYIDDAEELEWWPVIWLETEASTEILPMFCPALSWQQSRPWSVHVSRAWRCPVDWIREENDALSSIQSSTASWSFAQLSFGSSPASQAGWVIVNAGGEENDDGENNDIANLADVESTASSSFTNTSNSLANNTAASSSQSTAASSSDSRRRRWGNKDRDKKDGK